MRLFTEGRTGHLSKATRTRARSGAPVGRRVSRATTRACITHLAVVCNDMAVQQCLPQVLIVGKQQVSEARLATLRSSVPEKVVILREDKAWVSNDVMRWYASLLWESLRAYRLSHQVLVFCDVHRCHVSASVLQAFAVRDMWPILVPAKMTWALQPLDTHLFAAYKKCLADEAERRAADSESGVPTWEAMVSSLCVVIRDVMNGRPWAHAFVHLGLMPNQTGVSQRTLRKLELEVSPPPLPARLLNLSQLQAIFPARTDIPIGPLFSAVERQGRVQAKIAAPVRAASTAVAPPEAPRDNVRPWFGRTRSTSAQALSASSLEHAPLAPCPLPQPPTTRPPPLPPPASPPVFPLPPFLPSAKRLSKRPPM